jgi:hypothetical protein
MLVRVKGGVRRGHGARERDAHSGALGGQIGLRRRGWGDVHGHARVVLLQGIGPLGRGRSSGEVMAREVDGGILP